MPYITREEREAVRRDGPRPGDKPGVLTYLLWRQIQDWMERARDGAYGYTTMSEVVGCLETAKLEFCRRHLWPYEDRKIEENGDV